jgi:positive regulator of sigma E activity
VNEMAEEGGKAGSSPQKLSKEEIIAWWKKSCVEVGSDVADLRMSRISSITMFWLFILFGIFLVIALPTVNTKIEAWVTVLSAILFAGVAIWAFFGWKRVKVKLAEAEARAAKQ